MNISVIKICKNILIISSAIVITQAKEYATKKARNTPSNNAQISTNIQNTTTSFSTDSSTTSTPYQNSLGIGASTSFMQNNDFEITTAGAALQYSHQKSKYRGLYQLHISHSSLKPKNPTINPQQALHIGLFSAFDIGLLSTKSGEWILGIEGGYGFGFASEANNAFDESSLLLNTDIGYILQLKSISQNRAFANLLLYPYARLEQYIFLPRTHFSNDKLDYGLNVIAGLKFIADLDKLDWWINVGVLSDFNTSGNGIGVLGDNSIVYDKDGISNGILADMGINLLNHRSFALQGRFSINYALNYYELNLKGSLAGVWQF